MKIIRKMTGITIIVLGLLALCLVIFALVTIGNFLEVMANPGTIKDGAFIVRSPFTTDIFPSLSKWPEYLGGTILGLWTAFCFVKMSPKQQNIFVIVLGAILMVSLFASVGCFPSHQIREYSQAQIANDSNLRSGSPVLFVNRHEATSAEVHLFRGNLSRNEILTNVNGQPAIVTDKRIMKFALEPAFSDRDPAQKEILLDSNRAYTALVIVRGGGQAIKGPIYSVSHYSVRTSGDALRDSRSGLQRYGTVYANKIIEVAGTNTPVIDKLDLHMLFFPNQVVRDWLRR